MKTKIYKRIGVLFLSLTLCLGLLPVSALAYDYPSSPYTQLQIGKTKIDKDQYYLVTEDGSITKDDASAESYNVYYADSTLTLKDAKLTSAVYLPGGTTVDLEGENVSGSESDKVSIGIQAFSGGSITITGTGSYDVYTNYEGIATVYADSADPESKSDIIIEAGTLNMHGAPIGTRYGGITIKGDSTKVTAGTIFNENNSTEDIVIEDSADVTAESIDCYGKVKIQGDAVVKANNPKGMAISANHGIEILDNAEVKATGETAINAFWGPITINSTKKTTAKGIKANHAAISLGQGDEAPIYTLTIKSAVDVSGSVGIGSTQGPIVIDGGTVTADANYIGIANNTISAENASVTINNATVDVQGQPQAGINTQGPIIVENSTVTARGSKYAMHSMPALTFEKSYKVTAGASEDKAAVVPNSSLGDAVFNKNQYVKIEPVDSILVEGIQLSRTELSLSVGRSETLTTAVTPEDAANKTVTWTSLAPDVASVDANGKVTALAAGTAKITAAANDGSGVMATCTVTVTRPSSGGGSGGGTATTYLITKEDSAHGKVQINRTSASRGSTVTLTVTPDGGYELSALTVKDSQGNKLDLTDKGSGKFTFTMPGWAVTVEAVFKVSQEEPQLWNDPFTDVPKSAWYYDAVRYVYEHGLMMGTSPTTFSAEGTTTRGQIVTILWRMEGSPVVDYLMDFDDVSLDSYYTEAIRWAASEGVVGGYGDGKFGPNDPITREQFAVILYRCAQKQGFDTTQGGMAVREYADYDAISPYALKAMGWANAAGIIGGTSPTTLAPQGTATRAQAAAMLMRFCEQILS